MVIDLANPFPRADRAWEVDGEDGTLSDGLGSSRSRNMESFESSMVYW